MYRRTTAIFAAVIAFCLFGGSPAANAMHAFLESYVRASQVVDNAKLMNPKVASEMLEIADDTEFATGVQMILVTVPVLPKGWKPEIYAQYAAKELGLGTPVLSSTGVPVQKPGVLMMVSKTEEKVAFAMSPGLNLFLKNKILAAIIANEITPHLAAHDLQQAIRDGFGGLADAVQGRYKSSAEKRKQYLPFAILLPVVILMQVLFGDGAAARFFGGGAWRRW